MKGKQVSWEDDRGRVLLYSRVSHAADELVNTREGMASCCILALPRLAYTEHLLPRLDALYGDNPPVNAYVPALQFLCEDEKVGSPCLLVLGRHVLWERGEPEFLDCAGFVLPNFFDLRTNLVDLGLAFAELIHKHRTHFGGR